MKKVLQKQRSALKFLVNTLQIGQRGFYQIYIQQCVLLFQASARPTHSTEPAPKKSLLTTNESDNLFTTLEEDFNNVRLSLTILYFS